MIFPEYRYPKCWEKLHERAPNITMDFDEQVVSIDCDGELLIEHGLNQP
jgi:hypothetical protein